ncbi:MAG: hypothetical protein ACF8R9_00105 [Phycisphaerales bacterium JB054]
MRQAAMVVGVLVLVAVGAVFMMRSGGSGTGNATPTSGEGGEASRADGVHVTPGGGLDGPDAEALAELRAELDRAEPVAYRSDDQRYAEALAWVEANRPADRPYNEIEAKILALMDVIFDGEKRSAEWTMNQSQVEVEMIRALDADGDGQVSDDEVQMFIDENIAGMFNPIEHPYLKMRLDTDGDGELSPQEMMRVGEVMGEGALAGVFDRAKLESWDADNDGQLSADERLAGEAAAAVKAQDMFGDMIAGMAAQGGAEASEAAKVLLGDPALSPEEQAAARQKFYDEAGPEVARGMEMQRQMLLSQAASMDFMEAMRVDNLPSPDLKEMMSQMPQPSDPMTFDIDGDGQLAADEQAAHTESMQAYQEAVAQWGAEVTALRLKAQFENSVAQSDTNSDGRMDADEWDTRIDRLTYEREERLFLRSYDLDGSGKIEGSELNRYVEWYRSGSQRADVNYDGAVDARDLETMAIRYQRQWQ